MTQEERLNFLIGILCSERGESAPVLSDNTRFDCFRALVNVRPPMPVSSEFSAVEDEYLREELRRKGITDIADLTPVAPDIYLWKGDITTLRCDGIVNAANARMLGCFCPNHYCIDNAIHTFAGVRLRLACAEIMRAQGREEATGQAKITDAYNLPCKHVLHTVGPIVYGSLTKKKKKELESCYRSCLTLADKNGLQSLAFCCISTGEFRFPNEPAAEIAVQTVAEYKRQTGSGIKIIFDVFKDYDYAIYERLLGENR